MHRFYKKCQFFTFCLHYEEDFVSKILLYCTEKQRRSVSGYGAEEKKAVGTNPTGAENKEKIGSGWADSDRITERIADRRKGQES